MSNISILPLPLELASLQQAIQMSPFSDALDILDVQGDPMTILQSDLLTRVTDAIARKDPDAALQLLNSAVKAKSGGTRGEIERAWWDFTQIIQGLSRPHAAPHLELNLIGAARASLKRTPLKPRYDPKLVSFSTLKNVLSVLSGPPAPRTQWVLGGMKTLRVPNARAILNSAQIKLNERTAIYLSIRKGSDVAFHVADDSATSHHKYINITIETPKTWNKPLTEEQIRLLVARAILIAHIKASTGSRLSSLSRVWPNQLTKPFPLITLQQDGLFQYGPLLLPLAKRESLYKIVSWLISRTATAKDLSSWAPFLTIPRAAEILTKSIRNWIPGDPEGFAVLVEINPSLGRRIHLSLEVGEAFKGATATFQMSEETLKELTPEDFLDLIWRILSLREEEYLDKEDIHRAEGAFHDRNYKKPKPPDKRNTSMEDLRDGVGLHSQTLLGRGFLKLVFAYHQILQKELDPQKIHIPNKEFMNVLRAIRFRTKNAPEVIQAAWEDLLSVRYWHLQAGDGKGEKQKVQVFPFGPITLIQILEGSPQLRPLDLLFVLAAAASNPGLAIKVNLTDKTIEIGHLGETKDLYCDIAANPAFEVFHLHDGDATLPESFSSGFPGGIPANQNPYYAKSDGPKRRAYTKALLWFAPQPILKHWLPLATDSKETLQRKFRTMNMAWHPDRARQTGAAVEQQNLLTNSRAYWEDLFAIYP